MQTWIPGVLGVIAILGGIAKIARSRRLTARARGVIVSTGTDRPVFRFEVPGRGDIDVRSDVRHSFPPARGTPVNVRYDPDDPHHARIDRWDYSAATAGGVFIAIGLALIALAAWWPP
jgi:hypothetical protein